ncbi:MAG: hypothetical protein ACT4OG_10430 [Alphaproteobacteria bacterium]
MKTLFLATIIIMVSVGATDAADGVVAYNKSGCGGYFIVETNLGYALLEWYGGTDPAEGTRVVGDFESYGFRDIYLLPGGQKTRVWVNDYWLSRTRVIEKIADHCN